MCGVSRGGRLSTAQEIEKARAGVVGGTCIWREVRDVGAVRKGNKKGSILTAPSSGNSIIVDYRL